MDQNVSLPERSWDLERHLRHLDDGEWVPMLDVDGKILPGIFGKSGVRGANCDGTHIGGDYIKMEPGTAFPLHEHEGGHVIYFRSGAGFVHIDGKNIPVRSDGSIYIPGEYPHGVWVDASASEPLIFFAVGHPHKHVDAPDRMQHPHRHE